MSYVIIVWLWAVCFDHFDIGLDGFVIISIDLLVHVQVYCVCHMGIFDSTELAIFGLIQIWEYALNWFIVESVHEPKLDICYLCGLGATYPKHVFGWSLCANDSKLIRNLHEAQMQHIINITIRISSWTCVGGCKSMWKVHTCGTVASNCKASQKITN